MDSRRSRRDLFPSPRVARAHRMGKLQFFERVTMAFGLGKSRSVILGRGRGDYPGVFGVHSKVGLGGAKLGFAVFGFGQWTRERNGLGSGKPSAALPAVCTR